MKDPEFYLQLQAYLDGELSGRAQTAIEKRLEGDAAARGLLQELTSVRALLLEAEPQYRCPEGAEFYWSRVQERIRQQEKVAVRRPFQIPGLAWARRHLVAAGGVAVAAVILGLMTLQNGSSPHRVGEQYVYGSMESPDAAVHGVYFRSESAGATLVWLTQSGN